MKFLVVLCSILAYSSGSPVSYAYSAYSPYAYRTWSPAPYYYNARPISRFAYSVSEPAVVPYSGYHQPIISYNAIPAPTVKYVAPAPIVAAASASYVAVAPAQVGKSQYHSQDEIGNARYGHDEPGQSHHAIQDAAGNKYGTFSYIRPDGHVSITQYSADSEGYRVSSNDLPVGQVPAAPAVPVQPAPIVPVVSDPVPVVVTPAPVFTQTVVAADPNGDTVEVSADLNRKRRDDKGQEEKKVRSKRAVVLPTGYLADTPEVAAAKAAHFAEHAKRGSLYYYNAAPVAYSAHPYSYTNYNPYPVVQYSAPAYSAYPYTATPYTSYEYTTPFVTSNGYLADTAEVAAAKAAHFAEVQAAIARLRRDNPETPTKPADGYAPTYNAESYSRPVDQSAPILPLNPTSTGTKVTNNPNHGYDYKH